MNSKQKLDSLRQSIEEKICSIRSSVDNKTGDQLSRAIHNARLKTHSSNGEECGAGDSIEISAAKVTLPI